MRPTTATLVAALALGAAACGGDNSDSKDIQAEAKGSASGARTTAKETSTTATTQATTDPPTDTAVGHDSGGGRSVKISASDFPDGTWPLTIDSGELRCEDTKTTRIIIFSANGRDYPVNGVPEGGKIIGIEPIWKKKDDPNSPGTRMDISPLFKKGYELCD